MSTLTSPHDLLHAVPFFVGYHPSNSIVVISLTGDEIGFAMRIDFPTTDSGVMIPNIASHLAREGSDSSLIVLYPPDGQFGDNSDLECEEDSMIESNPFSMRMYQEMKDIFSHSGIGVREALLVWRGRWISLMCEEIECCPKNGAVLESIDSSRIAAEQVFKGRALPLATRRDLELSMAPFENFEQTEKIRSCIDASEMGDRITYSQLEQMEAIKLFLDIFDEFTTHGNLSMSSPHELALLATQVRDLTIRDYYFGVAMSIDKLTLAAFWFATMKIMPRGYRAPFAVLYASLMYECGDGAIANCALDIAIKDQDDYSMASLLRRAFTSGWPPEAFDQMRKELHPKICQAIFGHYLSEGEEE